MRLGKTFGARYKSPLIMPQTEAEQPEPVMFHFMAKLRLRKKEKASQTSNSRERYPERPSTRTAQRDNRFLTEGREFGTGVSLRHKWAIRELLQGLDGGVISLSRILLPM
jgi:hypothetical protein